jgi:hypothetical protein
MRDLTEALRVAVIRRAGDRCEYCGLAQAGQEAAFHIDHVIPRAAGGPTSEENLALACVSCSLHKAAKQTAVNPVDGKEVPLFNPRTDRWSDHFRWDREIVVGINRNRTCHRRRVVAESSVDCGDPPRRSRPRPPPARVSLRGTF